MRPLLIVLALTLSAASPLVFAGPRDGPPPLAIKDARIVVSPGKVIERGTIVFRDGRIEAVGPNVTPPPDALVEDGRGLTVYPGFIDAGAPFPLEATTPEAQKAREGLQPNLQEDPPIETPEARRKGMRAGLDIAATALLDGERRNQERKAGFTAALAVPPRGFLSGRSALFALGDRARRSSVLVAQAFLHASFDGPEGERGGYPNTPMGAHAHIRQAFADALRQRELEERAARRAPGPRPAFDPDLGALLPAIDRKLRVAWAADTDEDVARTLALGDELGLELVVTDARHAARSAAALRRARVRVILSLAWSPKPKPATLEADPNPPQRKGRGGKPLEGPFFSARVLGGAPAFALDPAPIGTQTKAGPEKGGKGDKEKDKEKERIDPSQEPRAVFEERERKRAEEVNALKLLHAAGVPVCVSSQGLQGPGEVRERLREAIKAGLSEEVAVAALTRDAALVLGVSDRLGTLAPGKLAFATVLTGKLSDEKAKVRFTIVDGEKLDADKVDDDLKLASLSGKFRFAAGGTKGELFLEAVSGKLTARVVIEGREAAISSVTFENDRVKLSLPKDVMPAEKKEVFIDARWIAPDALEGTATFGDGARVFRADREPVPHDRGGHRDDGDDPHGQGER